LELRQALQNGITVPTMMNGGITIAETAKLVTGAAIANSYASADCNTLSSDAGMTTYRTDYMAAYGSTPNYLSAITYDATLVAAAAVEKAGTVDKTAVNTAIGQLDFTGGICTPHYKADGRHSLTHENNILKFNQDGTWAKVATEAIPALAKIGS
jgi:ABC-type branched-subunit amino acid transport system substrate-binding protein